LSGRILGVGVPIRVTVHGVMLTRRASTLFPLTPLLFTSLVAGGVQAQSEVRGEPSPPRFYQGRQIAQTMHYLGAPWLVRRSRERQEECSTLLQSLRVQAGDVVCDLGCGNGFYTLPLAEMVGPTGRVLAVDIQKQMLTLLRRRAEHKGLAERIVPILSTPTDPKLPEGGVDLVLLVDVYHELSHPEAVLLALRKSLKPGGRIVLAEFREEDPKVPIKPLHKMSKRQILRELVPNGFALDQSFDRLPWQHLMFFRRRDDDELAVQARAGLARATDFLCSIAVHGGYPGIYSADLKQRYGEALYEQAGQHEIWVQPPGTPSVGQVFLRAFAATGDDRYFAAARAVGLALAWAQRRAGGWDHRADLSGCDPRADPRRVPPRRRAGRCTFDDNISQGALTFLIELDDLVEEPWLSEAIDTGLAFLSMAQFPNGAWPQWYPLRGGYHDHYTFNDGAINDCIRVALLAAERYGREDCLAMARRGGEFIIRAQLAAPQAGWAQQHGKNLQPAPARVFEPAAVCAAVTARNLRTLRDLHRRTGDAKFLAPIPAALGWLRRSRGEDGRWARFFELGTNRPLFADRDGKIYHRVEQLTAERRDGYAWYGTWGIPGLLEAVGEGRDADASPRATTGANTTTDLPIKTTTTARSPGPVAAARARAALAQLDARGRWLRDGRIHVADFVRNAGLLLAAMR
jgi:PelA/Pel-15E family pectate lyase